MIYTCTGYRGRHEIEADSPKAAAVLFAERDSNVATDVLIDGVTYRVFKITEGPSLIAETASKVAAATGANPNTLDLDDDIFDGLGMLFTAQRIAHEAGIKNGHIVVVLS